MRPEVIVVILAAGRGSRMGSLTDERPKCLLELAGKSLLAHQIAALSAHGCRDIVLVTGYGAAKVEYHGIRKIHNAEYETTNMVASLFCARDLMSGDHDMLVCYGDIVYEQRIVGAVLACDAEVCLPVDTAWRSIWEGRMPDPLSDAETLRMDSRGRIVELGSRPKSYAEIQGQYMGIFKVRADLVRELPRIYDALGRNLSADPGAFRRMYMTEFIQHLIALGWTVQGLPVTNGWLEVDTARDIQLYRDMYARGELSRFCALP